MGAIQWRHELVERRCAHWLAGGGLLYGLYRHDKVRTLIRLTFVNELTVLYTVTLS